MLIIKGAPNAPSMHRLGSLGWVLMGTPGDIEESHSGDSPSTGNHFATRYPSSDPKESLFSILFSGRIHPSGGKPTPAPHGWLASRGQGHCLTRATLVVAYLPRDSEDSDPDGLQVVVALFVEPAPSEAWGGAQLLQTVDTPPAPPPHQHLSGIYRHRSQAQSFQCKPVQLL